jgi:transposase
MAKPIQITIKESIKNLKALQRGQGEIVSKRMRVLIELKKHEKTGISKRDLSDITGINHNSINKWRRMYIAGGVSPLLVHGRIGFKKSLINAAEHKAIEKKLNDPKNGLRGYIELQDWLNNKFNKDFKYITVVKYAQRHFGSKIKIARKSHVKKDKELVDAFKKSSGKSFKK